MAMAKDQWKRVKVVVEVPILGDYSENDFKWDVENCLRSHLKLSSRGQALQFGRFTVVSFNRTVGRKRNVFRQLSED